MFRTSICSFFLFVLLTGCRVAEREGLMPLPEGSPPLTYAEMVNRARNQAGAALDAFYIDGWADLEQAALRLEESARLLPKTIEIPEKFKATLPAEADQLKQDSQKLLDAARTKNAAQVNVAMQRINERIRQIRPPEKAIEKMPPAK